jgi:drug/metabolite transporter (DMT)-like permease
MQLVGLGIGFAGVFSIGVPELSASGSSAAGVIMVLVAVAGYGLAVNIAVPLQQRHGALAVIARVQWVGLILTLPYALVDATNSTATVSAVAALVALGALGTGVAFAAMAALVGRVGATRGSLTIYFIPIIAIVLGVAFRNDAITASALLGTPLVLVGAWLTSRADRAGMVADPAP